MDRAGSLRELLRPPPHRGPLIAAGAVPLAVGLALAELRLGDALPAVHAAVLLGAGALIYWLGVQAPNEDGRPPAYQSVLLVTGLLLSWAGLLRAAGVLGAELAGLPAGAIAWTAALAAALALWPAFERNSALCLLLAAVLIGVALAFAVRWIFAPGSPAPYRWLLLAYAIALVLASLALRGPAPRHAELLLDAAGLAVAAIGLSGVVESSTVGLAGVWELALLAAGFGLLAFGALERSPGPAYVGALNTALFVAVVAPSGEHTLFWWPLVLIAAGAVALVAGLRPRRPLPPEPEAYKAGEAPLAARAEEPEEEAVIQVRQD